MPLTASETETTAGMSDFDLDDFIGEMSDGLAEKHPRPYRTPIGLARHLIETKILRGSRDQEAADRIQRTAAKPMRYQDTDVEAAAKKLIELPVPRRTKPK